MSVFNDVNKDDFYRKLETTYGVKREKIGANLELFRRALKETFPTKHYAIERKIMRVLHSHSKKGTFRSHDEIIAFTKLLELFMKDIELQTTRNEATINLIDCAQQARKLVSESKEQIKASEHLAAIGRVAGMVGHDIRNPLQAIVGDLYLLEADVEDMPDGENKKSMLESIDTINQNVEYINKIVSDLQDYARKTEPQITKVNLEKTVKTSLSIARIPENIEMNCLIEPHIELNTDKTYVERILTNLITNAVQAMPKVGKLTISAIRQKNSSNHHRGYGCGNS